MPTACKPNYSNPILKLVKLTTIKQLHHFIGFVNFFKAFWEYGAHIIMPQLTDLTGLSNKKFQQCWTSCRKCIFEEVKLLITSHILLNYPNPHLPYDIEPDASDYQLGTSNKQAGLPIAFFRRKLNNAQNNYSTIKKE
jgi:hypothetical protein